MSWSAECLHGLCSACTYEDCECEHHAVDRAAEKGPADYEQVVCWLHGDRCCDPECY